jgi:SAM-dependent methyltransferase
MERRFSFGRNWRNYLTAVNEQRIQEAERSLLAMLHVQSLSGNRFLDVGSGSGLFSLAAMRLGADRVHSFDFDPESVACTRELKDRYFAACDRWTIEPGDALDQTYLDRLGTWDVVYAWGVLHHTGQMWQALHNATRVVADNGLLFVAIYNDQGVLSDIWKRVKHLYNHASRPFQSVMETGFFGYFAGGLFVADVARGRNPIARYTGAKPRGMILYRNVIDWVGGYPFEVATPHSVFRFFRDRGFVLKELETCGGKSGCNQYVFEKVSGPKH